ncbi:arginase [Rhizobium halophytocola]|uniref:Arginase n=1 Tax=Rhizobium halophytocola TaxID=735519 RepID=A0ABS4E2S3_9HYPH|nr:arginase [Rhizobium halophytocola]MBP1852216.1 arginase [Rhizobium halophytocola]
MTQSPASITLIGVPFEGGAGRGGCAMGPAALRLSGIAETLADLGHTVVDQGDLVLDAASEFESTAAAKELPRVAGMTRVLSEATYAAAAKGTLPVMLGGDHSLSMGSVSGMARYAASVKRPLFVLWLDAHADFNTPTSSPSGNMHGMPVAFFCGLDGFPQILPAERDLVMPKNVFQIGIRSVDTNERDLIGKHGVQVFDMRAIDENGIAAIVRQVLRAVVESDGLLHVSLDVDFLDPEVAPGVGTTVPGGATFREAHLIMEMLHDSGVVASLDIVELNPFLDDRGKSARVMTELTASLFGRRILDRQTQPA